jgi:hypothetical protein
LFINGGRDSSERKTLRDLSSQWASSFAIPPLCIDTISISNLTDTAITTFYKDDIIKAVKEKNKKISNLKKISEYKKLTYASKLPKKEDISEKYKIKN